MKNEGYWSPSERCIACNRMGSALHHIKTRGSGGNDKDWNLIPLCIEHHTEVHKLGMVKFGEKYPKVNEWLLSHGWHKDCYGGRERWVRWH